MLSNSKQSGGIHVVSPKEEKEGYGGKDLQKRKVLRLKWKSDEWNTNNNKYKFIILRRPSLSRSERPPFSR